MCILTRIVFFVLTGVLAGGCIIINDDDDGGGLCIEGVRHSVLRTYNMPRLDGIHSFLEAEIYLIQGDRQLIEVEGPPNILDLLQFEIDNGVWLMDTRRCFSRANLRFYITLEELEYVGLSSSSDIVSTNLLLTNDLQIENFGSGRVDLEIDADDLIVDVLGSGDVLLYGFCDELDVLNEGSGNLGTFNLECEYADIKIRGSGNAEVTILDQLDAILEGSGNILYRGFPIINATILGSGSLIDAN